VTSKLLNVLLPVFINTLISLFSAAFLVLIVGVLLLTYSRDSREWSLEEGLPALLAMADIQLEVANVDSPRLSQWQIQSLHLSNKHTPMLMLKQLQLEITDASLFSQGLDIRQLHMDELSVDLSGWQTEASNSSELDLTALMDNQIRLVIQKLNIEKFSMSGLGFDLPDLSINAGLWLDLSAASWLKSAINLQLYDTPDSHLSLQADIHEDLSGLLTLSVKEKVDGYLHQLTTFPAEQAIDATLSLNFRADQSADTLLWTLNAMEFPWYQHPLSIAGSGHWHLPSQRLLVDEAELRIEESTQSFSGWWQGDECLLELNLTDFPLAITEPFQRFIKGGHLSGHVHASGKFAAPEVQASLDMQTRYQDKPVALTLAASGTQDRILIEQARIRLGQASAAASGELLPLKQMMNLEIHQLSGPLSIVEVFSVDLPAGLDLEVIDAQGTLKGPMVSPAYAGSTQARGTYQKQAFNLQGIFAGNTENITLEDTRILTSQGTLETHGLIDWHQQQLNLAVRADSMSSDIIALSGVSLPAELHALFDIQGSISGHFNHPAYSGLVSVSGDYKDAQVQAKAEINATPAEIQLKTLNGELLFQDQTAELSAEGLYSVTSKLLDARIRTRALPLSLVELAGLNVPETLEGKLNTDISLQGSLPLPRISGQIYSKGEFNGAPYKIEFSGIHDDTTVTVSLLKADWMNSAIDATGILSPDLLDLNIKLENMQTEILNSFGLSLPSGKTFPQGQVNIALNLTGTAAAPELQGFARVAVDNGPVTSRVTENAPAAQTDNATAAFPLILQVDFDTDKQVLSLQSSLTQDAMTKATLDLQTRLSPFINAFLQTGNTPDFRELPLDINAQGSSDIAWLNDFLEQDTQYVAGKLKLDVQIKGNINKPELDGTLELQEGSYRNAITQSRLDQVQLSLKLDNQSIQIRHASARDGERGLIRLEGGVDLAALMQSKANAGQSSTKAINLNLFVEQASLIRRDDIEGEANGRLSLIGNLEEITLSGKMQVSPFQILLDRIPKDSIPEIKVQTASQPSLRNHSAIPSIKLDVNVDVNQQAFIRGRGLDAELQGTLRLSGTSRHPAYTGKFRVIRGTIDLLAKTFKLEQGDVLFSNGAVSLFARARHKARDLSFIATLEGTLDNLKISLTTEPPLPQDEALARLLFGKSVRDMTPVQAIQLANAIQTLRGESGQFDPLGTARDILQVDRITIESQETTEGNGVAIGLGKYITDKVYVELTRTPEPAQPWKGSVEMELTPNLNLETTSSGSSSFGGVELQWKKDY
jgi:translocation and assembly module TamB